MMAGHPPPRGRLDMQFGIGINCCTDLFFVILGSKSSGRLFKHLRLKASAPEPGFPVCFNPIGSTT